MSRNSVNQTWAKQNKKLVTATFKKGFISAVYLNSSTADVFFVENQQTVVKGIPLASHIIASQVMVGDKCRVDVFDEKNPSDMVVAYIYGRSMSYQGDVLFATGSLTLNLLTGTGTIAHGLGVTPDLFWVLPFIGQAGFGAIDYPIATGADDTNITWTSSATNVTLTAYWFAIKF